MKIEKHSAKLCYFYANIMNNLSKKSLFLSLLLFASLALAVSACVKKPVTPAANQNENINDQQVAIEKEAYHYGDKTLLYTKNLQNDNYVTVYFLENNTKAELIREVPIDIPGGRMPEFQATSRPSIALLKIESGDSGGFFQEYYYIDIATKQVIKIRSTNSDNSPTLDIINSESQVANIQLFIIGSCVEDGVLNEGKTVFLNDLALNGENQSVIAQPRALKCVDPRGIGDIYSPSPAMSFIGITSDLSKIFFSLSADNSESGNKNILWQSDYSFDLINKIIKEESLTSLL